MTACSSTGQFCHDGSCGWQRRMRAVRARPRAPTTTGPRQPSTSPAATARPAGRHGAACGAGRQAAQDVLRPAGRTRAARRSARRRARHVARRCRAALHAERSRRARTAGRRAGRKPVPLARPARPVRPSCAREFRRHACRRQQSGRARRRALVDVPQPRTSRRERRRRLAPARRAGRRQVARTCRPGRRNPAGSAGRAPPRRAQQPLLQARELRQAEGEPGIVAERAEVAEVVGDALELERQRAQPGRARRARTVRHALERLAVGPAKATAESPDTRAASRAPSSNRQLGEAPLDALVHVAQPLLEPQHLLADDREAEVAGLDDAGMHRADRRSRARRRPRRARTRSRRAGSRPAAIGIARRQREGIGGPRAVPQPRPRRRVGRAQCRQVEDRTLHAAGGREDVLDARDSDASPSQRAARRQSPPAATTTRAHDVAGPRRGRRPTAPAAGRRRAATSCAPPRQSRAPSTSTARDAGSAGDRLRPFQPAAQGHVSRPRSCARPRDTSRPGTAGCTARASAPAPGARTPAAAPAGAAGASPSVSPNTIGCTRPKIAANATPSATEQDRRGPGLLLHRRRQDQEFAREHAERRHAEDRQRARASGPSRSSG